MLNVRKIIDGILEDTAVKTAAEARIARRRAILEDTAARRLAAEGAAPSWKAGGAGTVSYSEAGAWSAAVADDQALGSFLAEHHPTEVTAILSIPAHQLANALEALRFAGLGNLDARLSIAPAYLGPYLESLDVDVEEFPGDAGTVNRSITIVDPDGLIPAGVTATRTPPRLTVRLDPARRTHAIELALKELEADVEDTPDGPTVDDPAPQTFAEAVTIRDVAGVTMAHGTTFDDLRRQLEACKTDVLKRFAMGLSLPVAGTKAVLAERIVRGWLAGARPTSTVAR